MKSADDITSLLTAARHGDLGARDRAFTLLYAELGRLARAKLRAQSTFTNLDVTALVHESYIRLAQTEPGRWENRRMFFAYAASVMRSVIVDVARERNAKKRGSGLRSLTLTTGVAEDVFAIEEISQLDSALKALARIDAQLLEIVEMRYFAGLTIEDIASLLELSPTTIKRKWQTARAFLYTELEH